MNETPETERPRFPMFKDGTEDELMKWANKLGRSFNTVKNVRDGIDKLGPRGKRDWARLAGRGWTVEAMFGSEE